MLVVLLSSLAGSAAWAENPVTTDSLGWCDCRDLRRSADSGGSGVVLSLHAEPTSVVGRYVEPRELPVADQRRWLLLDNVLADAFTASLTRRGFERFLDQLDEQYVQLRALSAALSKDLQRGDLTRPGRAKLWSDLDSIERYVRELVFAQHTVRLEPDERTDDQQDRLEYLVALEETVLRVLRENPGHWPAEGHAVLEASRHGPASQSTEKRLELVNCSDDAFSFELVSWFIPARSGWPQAGIVGPVQVEPRSRVVIPIERGDGDYLLRYSGSDRSYQVRELVDDSGDFVIRVEAL